MIVQIHLSPEFSRLQITHIVYATLTGIDNHACLDEQGLSNILQAQKLALEMRPTDLAQHAVLQGYRQCLQSIGRSLKKFPPSAESLIRLIQKQQKFPRINTVVDLYNAAAIRSGLSLGVHDIEKIHGTIEFRFSTGGERFIPIGSTEKMTNEGDYIYTDDHTVLAWLDARDSELVKVGVDTRKIVILAQGNACTSVDMRTQVLTDLCNQLCRVCGGSYQVFTQSF